VNLVHSLDKKAIYRRALALRREGRPYDLAHPALDDVFAGSIGRFADLAFRLRNCPKVLDLGSGHGMLLTLLNELGHKCHGVDFIDQTERYPHAYLGTPIRFHGCNVEVDLLLFHDYDFGAIAC
jgi:hypothetical protein